MKRHLRIWALLILLTLISGCSQTYSESDLARAREAAYNSGYQAALAEVRPDGAADSDVADAVREEAYASGYAQGMADQQKAAADPYQQGYEAGYASGYARQEQDAESAYQQYVLAQMPAGGPAGRSPSAPGATAGNQPSATEQSTQPEPAEETVYVTRTGTKYHRGDCSHLSKSRLEKTLTEAKAGGYTPCGTCKPPQ